MNRFLYFLPGVGGCNVEMLRTRGIISRFATPGGTREHGITQWSDGPAGFGCAVALGSEPARYLPDEQLWEDCGAFWLGMEKNAVPGPRDLAREIACSGHEMELLDGNLWRVPLLRKWHHERCEHVSALPKTLRPGRDESGKLAIRPVIAKQYEHLDALAEEIWVAFCEQKQWTVENLFSLVSRLLAENYRMAAEETALLGLLDDTLASHAAGLAIDVPGIQQSAQLHAESGIYVEEPRT